MLALALHPSETRRPRHQVRASVRHIAGSDLITLRFEVAGAAAVVWPAEETEGQRRDELWKKTCFECFIGGSTTSYVEWNFSPGGDWAAYEFDSYRAGMRPVAVPAPTIQQSSTGDLARYEIDFELGENAAWSSVAISLTSVVIEKNSDGILSAPFYWALSHAGTKPDFHLRESFTLELEY